MHIRIDPQSPDPIFEQIVFQVKEAVARGELSEGDRLPSVRELARELSVNPNTVVRAYRVLEHEGVVLPRRGSGCFVTGRKSLLQAGERRRNLEHRIQRTLTEAFHLGFEAEEIRKAFEAGLKKLRFHGKGRSP